jgi:hypothetical protein
MSGPLYRFQVSEDILYGLWEKSNNTFGRDNNSIYYIRKNKDKNCFSLLFLFEDFIKEKYALQENALCWILRTYKNRREAYTHDEVQRSLIMHYAEGIEMLFHVLIRAARSINPEIDIEWVKEVKEQCVQQRKQVINAVIVYAYQPKEMSVKRSEQLTQKLISSDKQVYDVIYKLYEQLCSWN